MKPKTYSSLFADWSVKLEEASFSSPPLGKESKEQIVLFGQRVKDGAISARVTPLNGEKNESFGYDFRECNLLFRYADRSQFYVAGIGGFGRKYFIGIGSSPEWRLLDATGVARDVEAETTYPLRVEFSGERIALFHNEVQVLTATDNTYSSGFCGIRTNRTEARFDGVDIQAAKPRCFVIMPFAAELNYVYKIIKETVEQHEVECFRADKRYISEPIVEDVKAQIAAAELVIVDFTDRNPNVYFEAGLADAWKKKWIVLAQSAEDLAFDVQHIRTIHYSNKMGAEKKLKEELSRALRQTLGTIESGPEPDRPDAPESDEA